MMASTSRGRKILGLVLESNVGSSLEYNEDADSPCDDSNMDPDYDPQIPETGKRKRVPQYFTEDDFILTNESEVAKKPKLLDYKDETRVLPSPEEWEFNGITIAEMDKILKNKDKILQQNQKKTKNKKEKTVLLSPCKESCRKKCSQKINAIQRQYIFDYFKDLDYGKKQLFFDKYIIKNNVKYRKVDAENNRRFSVSYHLPLTSMPETNTAPATGDIESIPSTSSKLDLSKIKNSKIAPDNTESGDNETVPSTSSSESDIGTKTNILSVCKKTFIHTLGFRTDGSITTFLNNTINDMPRVNDGRGVKRGAQMKHISEENYKTIKGHIDSYHPQVSHYNIKHAPHRRYLPPDITVHKMHLDFNQKYKKVSYETYRKVFEKENIGFSAPSQDECSVCSIYKQHAHENEFPNTDTTKKNNIEEKERFENQENENRPESENHADKEDEDEKEKNKENGSGLIENNDAQSCLICDNYKAHKQRYTEARKQYDKDVSEKWGSEWALYAADMQKILILPKMNIKNSYFVSRLVVFHETFANLRAKGENTCILWHEAVMGRNAPDVVSAYYNVLIRLEDNIKHVLFWADNCTAQNKNWTLFTAFVIFVNENWGPDTITFKYFEPGHSTMKADSIHGNIAKKWNKTEEILDFDDLEKIIRESNKYNKVISLEAKDFKKFENGCMQRKKGGVLPKLNDIRSVQFRKGSKKLFYNLSLEEEFSEVAFLHPKFKCVLPESYPLPRGLNTVKINTITKELLPHMAPRKQLFWKSLPSSNDLEDLGKTTVQF